MTPTKIRTTEDGSIPRCDWCDKPGYWHMRANTLFLCDDDKRKLEWHTEDPSGSSVYGGKNDGIEAE